MALLGSMWRERVPPRLRGVPGLESDGAIERRSDSMGASRVIGPFIDLAEGVAVRFTPQ
jgi:hypothetical protein